jgi:hypothetical protein
MAKEKHSFVKWLTMDNRHGGEDISPQVKVLDPLKSSNFGGRPL